LENAALHVIIMDEFDAIARSRGGSDGKGGQGDAGVARDSVVNQLLAKMDGVQPLRVPTLVSLMPVSLDVNVNFYAPFPTNMPTSNCAVKLGHWSHQQEKSDRTR
jgi:SpoVK/Ycf46/Vps4 family AAA+-type ATPase